MFIHPPLIPGMFEKLTWPAPLLSFKQPLATVIAVIRSDV